MLRLFQKFYNFTFYGKFNKKARLKYILYISYIIWFGWINIASAQSPYYQQITDREGLPSMTIYDIIQGNQGYIWLGTNAGICRYDGVRFKTFQVPQSKGNSFSFLHKNSKGHIYFGNFNDQIFYIKQEKVYEVTLPKKIKQQGLGEFLIDNHNNLWVFSRKSTIYIQKYGSQTWTTSTIKINPGFLRKIGQDKHGNIWFLCGYHLYQITPQLKITQKITTPQGFFSFTFLENGEVLFSLLGLSRELYSYHLEKKRWKKISQEKGLENNLLTRRLIFQDQQKNIWICTNEGVKVYSAEYQSVNFTFLKGKFVGKVIQDREKNHWIITLSYGLFKIPNKDILHFNTSNSTLKFQQINCLAQDQKGNLFIGTNGNQLYYFDTKKQKISEKYQLKSGDIECLYFDAARQRIYIENGIIKVIDTQKFQETGKIYSGFTPKAISPYQDKYLVLANGQGGYIVSTDKQYPLPPDYVNNFTLEKSGSILLRNKRSRSACVEANQKRFWIGYTDDLYYYENAQARRFTTQNNESIIALNISQDVEGVVWVGTAQQGVYAIKNKKIILHLNRQSGLISQFCKRITKEGDNLYLGTNQGLQVYNLQTGQSRIFNQEDGLPSNEVQDFVIQKSKIYIATIAGLSILDKNFNTTNYTLPLIYITGLSLKGQLQKSTTPYQFDYDENNLTIHFTGIALKSSGKFKYKYRMLGLEEQWVYSNSSSNFARYPALPSGKYQFQVKVINEDGIESWKPATITITIAYPFWQKWWFIVSMVLASLALMGAIIFLRLRAYKRKANMEKALSKAALESLKLQMNPHFIFNAMGAIQHYMMTNDSKKAGNYLARFSSLMRSILENSRQEYISLDEEIEMLESYLILQCLRQEGGFKYQIEVDEQLDPEMIAIPPMFAQPFIENAVEHGIAHLKGGGEISILFCLAEKTIRMEIIDNGIGIKQSVKNKPLQKTKHRSLATTITKERIALYQKSLKKDIRFEIQSLEKGTQVVFHLPYQLL